MPKHHAQKYYNMDFVLKDYAKNTKIMLKMLKAEMFIHLAIQNFTMWLYIELRIIAGQQTISKPIVLCD